MGAFAGGGHHGGHGGRHHGFNHHGGHGGHHYNWAIPAIVGGALVYSATRPYYYNNYYTAPVYSYPAMNLGPAVVNPMQPIAYWCAEGDGYFPTIQSCDAWQVITK